MAKTTKSKDRGARGGVAKPAKSTARNPRSGARKSEDRVPLPNPDRPPASRVPAAAVVRVEETDAQAEHRERVEQARKDASQKVVEVVPDPIAAPGRVHQPVKESGLGTPSADARPGRSSFTGPLATPEVDVTERRKAMAGDTLKVQATQTGYYDDIRRRPGEVFTIHGDGAGGTAEDAFSSRWMNRVADDTPATGTKGPNQVLRERKAELLGISADTDPTGSGARATGGKKATRGRSRTASDEDVLGADD